MENNPGLRGFLKRHWEKMVLWAAFIGLFYLLRPLFLLILLTFLITYITKSASDWIVDRVRVNYRLAVVFVFALLVAVLGAAGAWIGPRVVVQSNDVLRKFAGDGQVTAEQKVEQFVDDIVVKVVGEEKGQAFIESERYAALVEDVKAEAAKAIKAGLPDAIGALVQAVRFGWMLLVSLLLALVFSFILVMDWRRIAQGVKELEQSRIRTFYLGTAPHLRAFAGVLGKALRAQAIIATCNMVLTGTGLWALGVPNIALLSGIVFLCGFVPILGTFLSSVPILLFGIQQGGVTLALQLVVLITIVHLFEAYVLNPKITAGVLHVHPILVLLLLLLGERFFGVWGMILGVPIGFYVVRTLTKRDEELTEAPALSGAADEVVE